MYEEDIIRHGPITIDKIIAAAKNNVPDEYRYAPWMHGELKRGAGLLQTADGLNCYLAAYGEAHKEKVFKAISFLPFSTIREPFEICDWGCGQGIATICLLHSLAAKGVLRNLQAIHLIEPSAAALARAAFNISQFNLPARIDKLNKGLPSGNVPFACVEAISFAQPVTIHLFSNILDINGIDLKQVAALISSSGHHHYVVCVGPANLREYRINAFCNNFDPEYVNFLQNYRETQFFRDSAYNHKMFGCFARVFRFNVGKPVLIPYEFYAPKQFFAAYQSDLLAQIYPDNALSDLDCVFAVLAPFDIGASIYDDPHPLLAVLNNMIVRGLPTKLSPWIESLIANELGIGEETDILGTIYYVLRGKNLDNEKIRLARCVPIGVARIQKVIIEAMLTGKLKLTDKWRILVYENDVPCAAMAIYELAAMFNQLAAATRDYDDLAWPAIDLVVISPKYPSSGLHLEAKVYAAADSALTDQEYDLVLDIATHEACQPEKAAFSQFRAKDNCYFNIRNSTAISDERHFYTTTRIVYKPLTKIDAQGAHEIIAENAERLRFFLRLLFRKRDFRPGQLPIISRALQLKSVIGLLPTGAGKSLTYQLAAFMQPGVAIIVDPLKSLMKDQYDGLLKAGIDAATFINSSVDNKDEREREMRESKRLFVFLSPERLTIDNFRKSLRDMRDGHVYFSYGVIDEVHCVSEWGHDFRFTYLHLGKNLYSYVLPRQTADDELNHITLMGLTATASFDVLADVERELSGDSAFPLDAQSTVRYENTNRLELQYRIIKIPEPHAHCAKWDIYEEKNRLIPDMIRDVLPESMRELSEAASIARIKARFIKRENIDENSAYARAIKNAEIAVNIENDWYARESSHAAAIVFCPHRQGSLGVNDSAYNKGIATSIGQDLDIDSVSRFCGGDTFVSQDEFISGKSNIMVATKAFGMGIDKPNVRFTVNVNHSGSLEAYVQEAGRAGRDRKLALSLVLYSDCEILDKGDRLPVDYGVHKFFYDGNFIGPDFEKRVIYHLMVFQHVNMGDREKRPSRGFMATLDAAKAGEEIVSYVSFRYPSNDSKELDQYLAKAGLPPSGGMEKTEKKQGDHYFNCLMKAIYRMCCVGLIEDFTVDYQNYQFRLVCRKLPSGGYYSNLKLFLQRYYSEDRAAREVEKARMFRGDTEIYKCLGYLIDFVYRGIAVKRKRAIDDVEAFCKEGIRNPDNWLEVNEELKDYLYFYFNSKYARPGYLAPNDEPFSIVDDTQEGKAFDPRHIAKYMRVIDDEIVGNGTPNDNVKHLLGAVRLVRRALTDTNPTIDFLNVFCHLYLKPPRAEQSLSEEIKTSYLNGYLDYKKRSQDSASFYSSLQRYKDSLKARNVASDEQIGELAGLDMIAEAAIHARWLSNFAKHFNN